MHVVWFIRGLCVVCYSCTEWHSDAAVHVVRRMNLFQPSHQGRPRDLAPTGLGFVQHYLSRFELRLPSKHALHTPYTRLKHLPLAQPTDFAAPVDPGRPAVLAMYSACAVTGTRTASSATVPPRKFGGSTREEAFGSLRKRQAGLRCRKCLQRPRRRVSRWAAARTHWQSHRVAPNLPQERPFGQRMARRQRCPLA